MNHYLEAAAVAVVASSILYVAGVGAGSPGKAAPSAYDSAFYKAQAELAKAQWRYEFAVADRARIANRLASHRASRMDLDASIAAVARASAAVKTDKAALALAQAKLASSSAQPRPIS